MENLMKPLIWCLFLMLSTIAHLEAFMLHQNSPIKEKWKEENIESFDELMISWNAIRPVDGKFLFYVRVKINEWSPWFLYASWGSDGQSSFQSTSQDSQVMVYQDTLEVMGGNKATAFQIKIIPEGLAFLGCVHGLHVYTNGDRANDQQKIPDFLKSIYLKVPGLSQMNIKHPRRTDLCSPTSATAVTRYLSKDYTIDPVSFAQKVWDHGFDIYGNWVLNVAEASTQLGCEWNCWVERLNGFDHIYQHLDQGNPVIVSVRGPLSGSAQPYAKGHLMAVIGYDSLHQKVICMDPAFPADDQTHVYYELSDFLKAWDRRGNVAYVFSKKESL